MPIYDVDGEKNTLRDGYATPTIAANPHFFTTEGFDSSLLPRVGHNIEAAVENFMTAYSAAQLDYIAAQGAGITQSEMNDFHASLPGQIIPMEKPDPIHSGGASAALSGFLEKSPVMALGLLNPVAGGAAMFGLSYGENLGEAKEMGLKDFNQMSAYATAAAVPEAAGAMIMPGGSIGKSAVMRFASRFTAGAATNVGLDYVSNWSRASVLDSFGYHTQAEQQRHYDMMQAMSSALMGGILNQGSHKRLRGHENLEDAAVHTDVADHRATESAPGIPADPATQSAHYKAMNATDEAIASGNPVDVSDHIHEGHTFVMKTPEQLQVETTAHWHADLDEKLARGEITPEQHAAAYDNPPSYEEARRGFDAAEQGETGSLADIQALRRAQTEAAEAMSAAGEHAKAVGDEPAPKRTKVTDALDSDDHVAEQLARARQAADMLGDHAPGSEAAENTAKSHQALAEAEAAFHAEMAEHEQYNIAAACAISFGI